jgi:ATP-binding cassette subfamily C protein
MPLPSNSATDPRTGLAELAAARAGTRPALVLAFVFSAFVNLLMLTAPLYMLQVYDRVLASRSEETLVALSLLAAGLFMVMGVLDHARGRILTRIGARLQIALDARVHQAALARLARTSGDQAAQTATRDLEAMARLWASPMLTALCDAPWTPLFLALIFVFHPLLGWLAVAGAVVLVTVSWLNQRMTEAPLQAANGAILAAEREARAHMAEAELVRALGMSGAAMARWEERRRLALAHGLQAADIGGRWSTATRSFRLFLQSAMLGLAAWLVLHDRLTAGAMLAASLLMGRTLLPIEQAIGHWPTLVRAIEARERLATVLAASPPPARRMALPRPAAVVDVSRLTVQPPGAVRPILKGVSFTLRPGQALGVIGPSGAGKSALGRALVGALPPCSGEIRLDGATLDRYDPETLGALVGYLPQRCQLFDGSIAENIARLQPDATPDCIIAAARAAGAHEMILALPDGYDTPVSALGPRLSGGQAQQIALARALFGDPVLLVLDEPNAHLDTEGARALNRAIGTAKASGAAVAIMAHRPAALQECDFLLVLKEGAMAAFGPRDAILRDQVRNAGAVARSIQLGATG